MKRTILAVLFIILFTQSHAQTLLTENFEIEITNQCEEGEVSCGSVAFTRISIKTGEKLSVNGTTKHSMCADGVTPCAFPGYEFITENNIYRILESGLFQTLSHSGEVTHEEYGEWWEKE